MGDGTNRQQMQASPFSGPYDELPRALWAEAERAGRTGEIRARIDRHVDALLAASTTRFGDDMEFRTEHAGRLVTGMMRDSFVERYLPSGYGGGGGAGALGAHGEQAGRPSMLR